MPKLTVANLFKARVGDTFPDLTVPGLRHRVRKGGIYSQWRFKAGPGNWPSIDLGKLPTQAELDMLETREFKRLLDEGYRRGMDEDEAERHAQDRLDSLELLLSPVRRKAVELSLKHRAGEDPRGEEQSTDSLGAIADRWLATKGDGWSPRTLPERRRHLERDWAPFRDRPLASLTWQELQARLEEIKRRTARDDQGKPYGGPIAANRSRTTLYALCKWAKVSPNPVELVDRPAKERERERELSLEELRSIWAAAGDGDHGAIVRLLMLSGQRREEVGGMKWPELDLERALWSLPGERTKNGKPHVVPLSQQAVAILRGIERRPDRDVFGNGKGAYSGWSRSKKRLDGRCKEVKGWTLHDLRRAWSTHLHELGVPPHVVEASINHLSGFKGGVAGKYNKAQYMSERAKAMQFWADHLLGAEPGESAKVIRAFA